MWLRKLVGIMMILAFIVINSLTVYGLVVPKKEVKSAITSDNAIMPPTIEFSADPTSIPAGTSSALKWEATGDAVKCLASSTVAGPWTGEKTQVGAESSGRITKEGNYTYTLTCKNAGGETSTTATITVGGAVAPAKAIVTTNSPAKFCNGRIPCYGPKDLASHSSAGNCWGYILDKVINISGFDKAYHVAKSGISSIEVGQVCGKDLGPSLGGSVSLGGAPRNHLQATKNNTSANTSSYFVGFYDSKK